VLWAADTANQLTLIVGAWPVFIKQYGRIAGLSAIQPPLLHHVWVSHIVIASVQLYFARRIYIFGQAGKSTHSLRSFVAIFTGLVISLILLELSVVVVYLVKGIGKPLAVLGAATEINVGTVLRASAVAIDVLLAGGMMYLLKRTSPHFSGSKKIIQRLLIITVGSGTLTAVCAAFLVMLVRAYPSDLHYCILEFPICSLYFSTLLVNLNAREFVKKGTNYTETGSNIANTSTLVIRGISRNQDSDVFVQVNRETDIKMDELNSFGDRAKV